MSQSNRPVSPWRRIFGWLCLLAAATLLIAAGFLVASAAPSAIEHDATNHPESAPSNTQPATDEPASQPPPGAVNMRQTFPTLSAAQIADWLATPPDTSISLPDIDYDPFTILPDRSRLQFNSYVAQRGDTIGGIASRYGLQSESIAWCNKVSMAQVLRPGDVVTIPPGDGACHRVLRTQGKTIRDIAEQYGSG